MNVARMLFAAAMMGMFAAPVARGEGWSLSKLNPFAKKETGRTAPPSRQITRRTTAPPKSAMPDLFAPIKKFNSGTKKFITRTADFLSPKNLIPGKKTPSAESARRDSSSRWASMTGGREKKASLIPSWLRPEQSRPSRTTSEFLQQPRVGFGGDADR